MKQEKEHLRDHKSSMMLGVAWHSRILSLRECLLAWFHCTQDALNHSGSWQNPVPPLLSFLPQQLVSFPWRPDILWKLLIWKRETTDKSGSHKLGTEEKLSPTNATTRCKQRLTACPFLICVHATFTKEFTQTISFCSNTAFHANGRRNLWFKIWIFLPSAYSFLLRRRLRMIKVTGTGLAIPSEPNCVIVPSGRFQ